MINKRRNHLIFISILLTLSALLTLSFLPTPAATFPPPPLIRL